jgi:hypothetical protein
MTVCYEAPVRSERTQRWEAEISRLESLVEEHRRDRKRMAVFLWGLLLCPVAGYFLTPWAMLGVAFVVLALYFCGLYLSSMHYWDRTDQLKRARRELDKLNAPE